MAQNVDYSRPFVLLNAGILKESKSLEVLFFGLSRPLLPSLSVEMGADLLNIGPVSKDKQHQRKGL